MQDYIEAMNTRAALQSERKAEQDAETEAAQQRALAESRAYMAGLQVVSVDAA